MESRADLVHLDRVTGGSDPRGGRHMDKLRRTRAFQPVLTDIRKIAPSGWYGDPSPATEARGREMMAAIADHIPAEGRALFDQLEGVLG